MLETDTVGDQCLRVTVTEIPYTLLWSNAFDKYNDFSARWKVLKFGRNKLLIAEIGKLFNHCIFSR